MQKSNKNFSSLKASRNINCKQKALFMLMIVNNSDERRKKKLNAVGWSGLIYGFT